MPALCYETINYSPYIAEQSADLPAQISAAAEAGFAWIGIDEPSIAQHEQRGGNVAELARALRSAGLRCLELQPLIVGGDRAAVARDAERFAELADALSAPWVQCGLIDEPSEAVVSAFRAAADRLADVGAALAVEYLPFTPLKSIGETRAFLARADRSGAGVVVDTWHFFHGPDDWSDLEDMALEELAYVQFNDHPCIVEAHSRDEWMQATTQERVLPGTGCFELERFCRSLRSKGYTTPVSVEILSAELRRCSPEEFAGRVFEASAPFWCY